MSFTPDRIAKNLGTLKRLLGAHQAVAAVFADVEHVAVICTDENQNVILIQQAESFIRAVGLAMTEANNRDFPINSQEQGERHALNNPLPNHENGHDGAASAQFAVPSFLPKGITMTAKFTDAIEAVREIIRNANELKGKIPSTVLTEEYRPHHDAIIANANSLLPILTALDSSAPPPEPNLVNAIEKLEDADKVLRHANTFPQQDQRQRITAALDYIAAAKALL